MRLKELYNIQPNKDTIPTQAPASHSGATWRGQAVVALCGAMRQQGDPTSLYFPLALCLHTSYSDAK